MKNLIKKLKVKEMISISNILYADFETVTHNGKQYVTCYSIVDSSENVFSGVITYLENKLENQSEILLTEFLEFLFNMEEKIIVYFHNLLKFDIYFLLEVISKDEAVDIEMLSRENTMYSVKLKRGNKSSITFKDTFLMLPMSLKTLSTIFTDIRKGEFDHLNEYDDYDNPLFVKNIIDYCVLDSRCLKTVYNSFRQQVYTIFSVDILDSLTISSLSLKIYRTRYYNESATPIFIPNKSRDSFIRDSYYGGVVELYKPYMYQGWHLDVNALYPSVMKDNLYPTGDGTFVDGKDINLNDFYGFVRVEVYSPNVSQPFLVKNDKSMGLISPSGCWEAVYFSEEIKYAITLGYKFTAMKGISYEPKRLFSEFVHDLYGYRIKSGKNSPLGITVKLLMNSLYGRFGMKLESSISGLINEAKFLDLCKTHILNKVVQINKLYLVHYKNVPNESLAYESFERGSITHEDIKALEKNQMQSSISTQASVGIASAVTAYARIKMHKYKLLCSEDSLYYTDTDSLFTTKKIPPQYISETEIGMLKLEGEVRKAIFVSPKSYYIEYYDGKIVKKSKGFKSENVCERDYIQAVKNISKNVEYVNPFFIDKKSFEVISKSKSYNFRSVINKRIKVFDSNGDWISTKPVMLYESPIKFSLK